MNLLIALPAALVTLALLWFAGASGQVVKHEEYQFIRVVPYLAILVMALAGVNVFIVLLAGIVFWRYGLEAAMLTHVVTYLLSHGLI